MLAPQGCGPGAPLSSSPRATCALSLLCKSTIRLISCGLTPLGPTSGPQRGPRP
ncbi:hypothetical protein E2C01_101250 [Portunus trituberculatus]|uniref:Uncharacterized protein n=1 Tax=Portunus trituberculatus TaxID=210409 RepID=A0A5B7KA66_PORTR|nr:hypothetical protein [Portunus trituberculatus]